MGASRLSFCLCRAHYFKLISSGTTAAANEVALFFVIDLEALLSFLPRKQEIVVEVFDVATKKRPESSDYHSASQKLAMIKEEKFEALHFKYYNTFVLKSF